MTDRGPSEAIDRGLPWVFPAVFTAYATVLLVGDDEFLATSPVPDVLFNAPFALAAGAAFRSSRRRSAASHAWRALGAAMAVYFAANMMTLLVIPEGQYPSVADALWLLSYAIAALALVLLAGSTVEGVTRAAMLDGAIVGVVAAAAAATFLGRLLEVGDENAATVVTNLAYPIADLLLLGVLVTTTKLVARVDRVRVLLLCGYLSLLIGDSIFFWGTAQGTWVPDAAPELFFVGAATCIGLSGALARPRPPLRASSPHLWVPAFGGASCIALLAWGQVDRPGPVAVALTVTASVLVGVRVASGIRDLRARAAQAELSPARLAQLQEVRDALHAQEIVAHFQPQIDLRTNEVIGAEVLARWIHPSRGLVGPDEFLPLLAEGDLMARLTQSMLHQAARAHEVFAGSGYLVSLSVNLSTPELTDPELLATVGALADALPHAMGGLTLEITEESVLSDPASARDVLAELRDHGVRISVDDYGTGHASLAYLRDLPLDEVKLDRSFVRGAWVDERAAAIAASTVELAHHLELSIVAEGIEDAETNSWLRSLGCDVGQGYFHARPMPLDDLMAWMADRDVAPAT